MPPDIKERMTLNRALAERDPCAEAEAADPLPPPFRATKKKRTLYADGLLTRAKCPTTQKLVKVPDSVLEFIEQNTGPHDNSSLILAHLLIEGMGVVEKKLAKDDYTVRL